MTILTPTRSFAHRKNPPRLFRPSVLPFRARPRFRPMRWPRFRQLRSMAGPILLTPTGSIALQGSGIALYDQTALEDCCCDPGECNCSGVSAAVPVGSDWAVTLAGFVDDDCDDCASTFNTTHNFLDVARAGCGMDEDLILAENACGYSVTLLIDYNVTHTLQIRVVAVSVSTVWVFESSSCTPFDDLLAGTPVNVPFDPGQLICDPMSVPAPECLCSATPTCSIVRTDP